VIAIGHAKKRVQPAITSLVNRNLDEFFIQVLLKLVKKGPEPYAVDSRGCPHPPRLVIVCLILKIFWCASYDGIESRLKPWKSVLCDAFGVDSLPKHSTIHEAMGLVGMKYLRRIMRKLLGRLSKHLIAATDSTGLGTKNSSVWFDIRIKRKNRRKDCIKIHIIIDIEKGYILDYHVTGGNDNDCPIMKKLLRNIKELHKLVADSGYLSRENTLLIGQRKGRPFIMPKKNSTAKTKGSIEWKLMIRAWKENENGFKQEYHCRSIVEAVFSALKRRFGGTVRSIKGWYQKRESAIKVLCYNIKEYLYNWWAGRQGISRWKHCTCEECSR
jgi:transposase